MVYFYTQTQPHGFGLLYVHRCPSTQTNSVIKTYMLYHTTNTYTDSQTIKSVKQETQNETGTVNKSYSYFTN